MDRVFELRIYHANPGKMNAFSQAMRDRLSAVLADLNADPECRAIVLTGSGEHFSAPPAAT